MRFIKAVFGFFISRTFWTMIGLVLLSALIWLFGPLLRFGTPRRLTEICRASSSSALIVIFWLITMLIRQIRAARANRMFVTELCGPGAATPPRAG